MKQRVKIILKSGKDQSLHRYHPWVFSGAIKKMDRVPVEGEQVELYDNKDNFLAVGYFHPGSIAVRVMDFVNRPIDESLFRERIDAAFLLRKKLALTDNPETNVYRLIHGEGDGLPGLIVDYYNGVAVTQYHSVGLYNNREIIASLLHEILGNKLEAVYDKSESTLPKNADVSPENGFITGAGKPGIVKEHGYRFNVDWVNGQKTGFFIDQRENRKLLQKYSSDRYVLNMFGYTGGFSVYAMENASLVHTVDVSSRAVGLANENADLNFPGDNRHKGVTGDAFKFLEGIGGKYDLIVLDPPAFAKHNNVMHNALQGYKRLNLKAIEQIKPGGIIFSFSCSQVVSRDNFRKSVFVAAANTGRRVRILHQLSQPPDHPVNIYHPESEYLKGLVLFVE